MFRLSSLTSDLLQARGVDTQSSCVELKGDLARSHQERGALIQKCVDLHKQNIEDAAGDKGKARASRNMVSSARMRINLAKHVYFSFVLSSLRLR